MLPLHDSKLRNKVHLDSNFSGNVKIGANFDAVRQTLDPTFALLQFSNLYLRKRSYTTAAMRGEIGPSLMNGGIAIHQLLWYPYHIKYITTIRER